MLHKPDRNAIDTENTDDYPAEAEPTCPMIVCNHTTQLSDEMGKPLGSWIATDTKDGIRYSCGGCGKLYGYQPNKKVDTDMYRAYLEQQRRRACPGCGEDAFLG